MPSPIGRAKYLGAAPAGEVGAGTGDADNTTQAVAGLASASSRQALRVTLGMAEEGVGAIRRDMDRLIGRAEMHLRAWSEALAPDTLEWARQARTMVTEQTPEEIRAELQTRIEQVRPRPYGRLDGPVHRGADRVGGGRGART